MAAARDWEDTIRAVVSHALSQRGCRRGVQPIPWQCDRADQIRDAVVEVFEGFQQGIEPDACVARMPRIPDLVPGGMVPDPAAGSAPGRIGRPRHRASAVVVASADWADLVAAFREHKLLTGDIKVSTWHRVVRHPMKHVLGVMSIPMPPCNAKPLLEALARIWADKPGGRTREIQIQTTAALLRWGIAERRLGEEWEPLQDLALVQAIPDSRWRFAFQLMAAYGLRPEELQHLQIPQGRLWCLYESGVSMKRSPPAA